MLERNGLMVTRLRKLMIIQKNKKEEISWEAWDK